MTTSGDTIYELTRDNIIAAAMRKIGALAKGQSPDSEDLTNGMQALNALIASWQSQGLTMWKFTEMSITLVANTRDYTIGIGQTNNQAYPLRIESAYLRHTVDGHSISLEIMERTKFQTYNNLTQGTPTTISYIPLVNAGFLSLWPRPDTVTASAYTLRMMVRKAFEGFNSASETPDLPQEFQLALIYGLAMLLAPEYGVPLKDRELLLKEYGMYFELALGATQGEDEKVYLQPNSRMA